MSVYYNKHYVAIDAQNRIVDGWSTGPFPYKNSKNSILINLQGGYQFRLVFHSVFTPTKPENEEDVQLSEYQERVITRYSEENPSLFNMDGIPLYKYEGGEIIKRTEIEIEEDYANIPASPPSEQEKMEAQVFYTAMMTDTLLEEE